MSSGGKDCTLALERARESGLDVNSMVTLYDGATNRVRIHGTPIGLIERQAELLGLEPITRATSADGFEDDFQSVLATLVQDEFTGVVFGNIHLSDVRAWYEERVRSKGLEHIEPIWGEPPAKLARETVERGYSALIISVMEGKRLDDILGRVLDGEVVDELERRPDIDPCGEFGEYHTLVCKGPAFSRPLDVIPGDRYRDSGHLLLDLTSG